MDREKRHARRVPVSADVRIRAAGSSGRGIPCRVVDAGPGGVRFRADDAAGAGWDRVEVLESSGQALDEPLEARVVHVGSDANGYPRPGCSFD